MKEHLKNFIDKEVRGKSNLTYYFAIIATVIGIILSIPVGISQQVKEEDYQALIKPQQEILQNFDNVYNLENVSITTSEDKITVTIDGNNCSQKVYFDKNKTYLCSERVNESVPIPIYTVLFALLSFFIGVLTYWVFMIICFCFYHIMLKIENM